MLYRIVYLISLLPFRVLYAISDVMAWLACDVLHYRRQVVHDNLTSSFQGMTPKEYRRIQKGFYRYLCDYVVETIKLASMSPEKIKRRLKVENVEIINEAVERGQSVSVYLGHYGNWEWISSTPLHFAPCAEAAQVYHPLENKTFDKVLYKLRTRFGAHNVAMADIMKTLVRWHRDGIPSITGYIADQAPGYNMHLFLDFLNHDTGVYTGPERLSKMLGAKAVYGHLTRPKRGYYTLRFITICDNVKEEEMFETTRRYFKLLEENILEAPQYWLWSHRRWKRPREYFYLVNGEKKGNDLLTHL